MRPLTVLLSTSLHLLPISSLFLTKPPATLITLPTHNLTLTPFLTASEEPDCVRIVDPPMVGVQPTSCDLAVPIICERLVSRRPEQLVRDTWIWVELPGCALGYYLPEDEGVPTVARCKGLFERMVEKCALNSRYNAGGINVAEMPDFSGPGRAETEGVIRYAFAPERLTLPH